VYPPYNRWYLGVYPPYHRWYLVVYISRSRSYPGVYISRSRSYPGCTTDHRCVPRGVLSTTVVYLGVYNLWENGGTLRRVVLFLWEDGRNSAQSGPLP